MVSNLKGEGANMIEKINSQIKKLESFGQEDYDYLTSRFKPDWEIWSHCPRATLIQTIALSCGVCPDTADKFDFDFDTKYTGENFFAIVSIELTRRLQITLSNYRTTDFDGELSTLKIPTREISTHKFYVWANSKGWELPPEFPHETSDAAVNANPVFPWGTHSTKLLTKLSEAAHKFWSLYDPNDPSTAPTNEQVQTWLISEGVKERNAEVMATILRADGLATGRRK